MREHRLERLARTRSAARDRRTLPRRAVGRPRARRGRLPWRRQSLHERRPVLHRCLPCAAGRTVIGGFCVLSFGEFGTGDGQFNLPYYLSDDGNGNVYVSDFSNNRIQKFTGAGRFLAKWGPVRHR